MDDTATRARQQVRNFEDDDWKRWHDKLPARVRAKTPRPRGHDRRPEETRAAAVAEAEWRATLPADIEESIPVAPIERHYQDTIQAVRPAPVYRRDATHPLGHRLDREIKTAPYDPAPAAAGSVREAASRNKGGDVETFDTLSGDGLPPAPPRKKGKARRGITTFGPTWLRTYERPRPKTWQDCVASRVAYAKSRILEWEATDRGVDPRDPTVWARRGPHPLDVHPEMFFRCLSGRAHASHVLEDADAMTRHFGTKPIPGWVTENAVRFLIALASFEAGGAGQRGEAEIRKLLRSRDHFAKRVREWGEAFVSEYTLRGKRKAHGLPDHRAVRCLSLALQLADEIQGTTRPAEDAWRSRLADLKRKTSGSNPDHAAGTEALAFYRLLLGRTRRPRGKKKSKPVLAERDPTDWSEVEVTAITAKGASDIFAGWLSETPGTRVRREHIFDELRNTPAAATSPARSDGGKRRGWFVYDPKGSHPPVARRREVARGAYRIDDRVGIIDSVQPGETWAELRTVESSALTGEPGNSVRAYLTRTAPEQATPVRPIGRRFFMESLCLKTRKFSPAAWCPLPISVSGSGQRCVVSATRVSRAA